MRCHNNHNAYATPAGAPTYTPSEFQPGPFNSSPYGSSPFQGRRGCPGGRHRGRGGLFGLIARAIHEKREAKQAQSMLGDPLGTKDLYATREIATPYNRGYQRSSEEYKENRNGIEERRSSADSGLGDMTFNGGPPPSYEMVEMSDKKR